jgi:hypothetical protein
VPKKGEQKDSVLSAFDFAQVWGLRAPHPQLRAAGPGRRCISSDSEPAPLASPPHVSNGFERTIRLQTRSKRDAELLWDAKYGERGADGKMSREQYAALRRKIGGTAKDYWKVGGRVMFENRRVVVCLSGAAGRRAGRAGPKSVARADDGQAAQPTTQPPVLRQATTPPKNHRTTGLG